jgi:diguanylate cyclase (GGDEF)-like protein
MINDAMGHAAGDELLVTVADRLRGCLRAGDSAARHGGDSFTALLTGLDTVEDAADAAERVRVALNQPLTVGGQRVECSVSVGVAIDVQLADSAEDLLRHADAALYRAKDGGRNRVQIFDQASRTTIECKLGDGAELRDAMAAGQFVAWFQPIVEMSTGRIVGAEALARWMHPRHGVLAPGRFLPLATEIGVISMLSRQICLQTMALRRDIAPLVDPSFRLSFNVGIGEYSLVQIIDRIMVAATELGAPPSGLTLEILETAVIDEVEAAGRALTVLRKEGFAVALDDFGTGYSSLSLLRDLPLDTIKIDRSFVQRMAGSPADAAIVESVLDLATHLSLGVVAEGVETDDEVARLISLGATRAQGYRYSPAVPPQEFVSWLRDGPPWLRQKDLVAGKAVAH